MHKLFYPKILKIDQYENILWYDDDLVSLVRSGDQWYWSSLVEYYQRVDHRLMIPILQGKVEEFVTKTKDYLELVNPKIYTTCYTNGLLDKTQAFRSNRRVNLADFVPSTKNESFEELFAEFNYYEKFKELGIK